MKLTLLSAIAIGFLAGCAQVETSDVYTPLDRGHEIPLVQHDFAQVFTTPDAAVYAPDRQNVWTPDTIGASTVVVTVRLGVKPRPPRVFSLPTFGVAPIPQQVANPGSIGSSVETVVVRFSFDHSDLDVDARSQLDAFIKRRGKESERYTIDGFTDSVGTQRYNDSLSVRRANSVRDYLVRKGLPKKSLIVRGNGDENPVAPNATDIGRAENRRASVAPGK